jgi:hypothetical protein
MSGPAAHEALGLRFERLSLPARAALVGALAALWLLGRRYAGISNDATLYVGQGLRRLYPEAFAADLFFAHGGQDAFTLFPLLYAPLIAALGAGGAALLVTIAGQAAFLAAAAVLVTQTVPSAVARWWSLALLAVTSGYYGGVGTFRIAEAFATARVLAEPLVLAAIACLLAGRLRASIAALLAAALLHPLVAAPGIAAVFLWHALERRRLLWLAAVALIAAAVWASWQPRFDPLWRDAVLERSPHLFIAQWHAADWARLAWGLCIAALAVRIASPPLRRLLVITIALAAGGVALSWVAVDLLGSVAAAVLQPWRAHWLLHFLAIIQVPWVVAGLWRAGNAGRAAAACVAASCCFGRDELPAAAALAVLAVILARIEQRSPGWMGTWLLRGIAGGAACAAAVGLMLEVQERMPAVYGALQPPGWPEYALAATTVGGLLPIAIALWVLAHTRFGILAFFMAALTLAAALSAWDARTPWRRFLEQESARANPFRAVIPPGSQVFWRENGAPAWLALRTPSWFSSDQGAGIVFSRETAITYAARKQASQALRDALDHCVVTAEGACRVDSRLADALCSRPDGPDYLVLPARLADKEAVGWHLPAPIGRGWRALFLYPCAK